MTKRAAVEFVSGIAQRLGVRPEDLRAVPERRATSRLAPLEPDAFLRWAWEEGGRVRGTGPLTVDDIAFEFGEALTREQVRRMYVRLAALARRNQRLGNHWRTGLEWRGAI